MKSNWQQQSGQSGMILIDALMAILVFSLGILGMVGVQALAVGGQSDAQFRNEANQWVSQISNEMWLNVDRTSEVTLAASVASFAHRIDVGACDAAAGTPSVNALVTNWVNAIKAGAATGGLPGTDLRQQILVNPGNQVTVTVCWHAPSDVAMRRHVVTTYIH
jgi:type IV pilus assembly protein PilV